LQDIAAKKRAVIELAERFTAPFPYNSVAYNLVKFIEAGSY